MSATRNILGGRIGVLRLVSDRLTAPAQQFCLTIRRDDSDRHAMIQNKTRIRTYRVNAALVPYKTTQRSISLQATKMALSDQDPTPAQEVDNEQASDYSSDDEGELIERWAPVVNAIVEATKKAFPNSPPKDSAQEFQRYWRNVFNQLSASVATDSKIPTYLTEPSTKKFTANFFDEPHSMCCPCSFPQVDPQIVLENESGVTKDDFMKAFVDAMYGDALPKIYDEDGQTTEEGICGLVYDSDWMSSGDGPNGERIAYASEFSEEYRVPNIFMYCCEPEVFSKKSEQDDAEEKVEAKESKL